MLNSWGNLRNLVEAGSLPILAHGRRIKNSVSEFVFNISSTYVKIRLLTENQLLWLPESPKDVMGPDVVVAMVWWSGVLFFWL